MDILWNENNVLNLIELKILILLLVNIFYSENKNILVMDDLDNDLNEKKEQKSDKNINKNNNNNHNNNNKSNLGAVKKHIKVM